MNLGEERWKQVSEIFQQALSRPPDSRASFLDHACAGNESLRSEIDELLALRNEAGSLLEIPLIAEAASSQSGGLGFPDSPINAGRSLAHYRILEKIGQGGMGIVYRARDEHLQRDVAVKVLPPGTLDNQSARKRFRNEALALSKLNHPNIGIIHDFDTQEEIDFLVMEYVPGETLREKLAAGPLPIMEIASLGEQLAAGLESAHSHGVVHCDLKPGNLIAMEGIRLKILDFGLAKLLRVASETPSARHLSEMRSAGGTLPYMSPEQLRGGFIDARSDIFSCGAVLYEMATGRQAFQGGTAAMVSDGILNRAPDPPARVNTQVPVELQRIILQSLEKDRQKRYQSATDLLADLRHYISASSEAFTREQRRKRLRLAKYLAVALLPAVAALILAWIWLVRSAHPLPLYRAVAVTSTMNWEGEPAVSPDGNEIVYTSESRGNRDIWMTDMSGTRTRQLTFDPAEDSSPAWFPDKKAVAFVSERGGERSIYKLNLSDLAVTLLVAKAQSPSISADGKYIAYSRGNSGGALRIARTSLIKPDDVEVLSGDSSEQWDHFDTTWSPDSTEICYWSQDGIWIVAASGGKLRRLISGEDINFDPWCDHHGSFIYYCSNREGNKAIWRVKSKGGLPERVSLGTGGSLSQPSLPWSGNRLVYATSMHPRQFTLLDRASGKETVFSVSESDLFASLSDDSGKMVYAATKGVASGFNLWAQRLVNGGLSSEPRQLTQFPDTATDPAIAPDGKWIAYCRIVNGKREIWVMSAEDKRQIRFSDKTTADVHPTWSPHGDRLAFSSDRTGGWEIWVAPVMDGLALEPARELTPGTVSAMLPAWSPNGDSIAFIAVAGNTPEVWTVPSRGGARRQITHGAEARRVRWDPESGDLMASATWGTDRVSLYRISLRTGPGELFSPHLYLGGKCRAF